MNYGGVVLVDAGGNPKVVHASFLIVAVWYVAKPKLPADDVTVVNGLRLLIFAMVHHFDDQRHR